MPDLVLSFTLTIGTGSGRAAGRRSRAKVAPFLKWARSQKGRNELRALAIFLGAGLPHTIMMLALGLGQTLVAFTIAHLACTAARLALQLEAVTAQFENADQARDHLTAQIIGLGNPFPKDVQPKPDWLQNLGEEHAEERYEIGPHDGRVDSAARD